VEVLSGPANQLFVLFMRRVENYFQKLLVTLNAVKGIEWVDSASVCPMEFLSTANNLPISGSLLRSLG
jgi:hypothetical protein